jgi:hypothetical protein
MPHLLLQLEDAKHQRLRRRRTPGHINIHRHDAIATPRNRVTVVVVPPAVGAAAHADDPARLGHLVVHLPQRGRHLVGQSAGDDHDVRLPRRGAEDDAQAILVVAGRGEVHHFDGAAGEAEGHGPEGALAGPVCDLVHGRAIGRRLARGLRLMGQASGTGNGFCCVQSVLHGALGALLAGQRDLHARLLHR